jgi:hypothetical protein
VWLVSAVGQPDQVIELRSPSDQILGNFRGLVPHKVPVDGGPVLEEEMLKKKTGDLCCNVA